MEKHSAVTAVRRLSFSLVALLVVLVPLGYYLSSWQLFQGELVLETEVRAKQVMEVIARNPELWTLEHSRLGDILSRPALGGAEELRSIHLLDGARVAEVGGPLPPPLIFSTHSLSDSGVPVATFTVTRTLRPLLVRTAIIFLVSLLTGGILVFLLRAVPLRLLAVVERDLYERAALIESSDDLIGMSRLDGRLLFLNRRGREMLGLGPSVDVHQREVMEFVPPDLLEFGRSVFQFAGEGRGWKGACLFTRLDGEGRVPVEAAFFPIHEPGSGALRALGVTARDVSERKEMEEKVVRMEQLEAFGVQAAGFAHDLDSLLAVVLGNIDLARRADPDWREAQKLEDAEKAVSRASGLVRQFLAFARGGAPVKKPHRVGALLAEAVATALSAGPVRAELVVPHDLWMVEVDAAQVSQVFHNLLANAAQAMPGGGVVRVTAENLVLEGGGLAGGAGPSGSYVRVRVRDSGVGIAETVLPHIFDPSFTTRPRGSGLGLVSAHSFVTRHGGFITVESREGTGTVFGVHLPVTGYRS